VRKKKMMKKLTAVALMSVVLLAIRIVSPIEAVKAPMLAGDFTRAVDTFDGRGSYKDGYYEGSASAYNGDLTMGVTVQKGWIVALAVVETKDDKEYLDKVVEPILKGVLDKQNTLEVDAVTGATFSSYGILDAIDDALAKAE